MPRAIPAIGLFGSALLLAANTLASFGFTTARPGLEPPSGSASAMGHHSTSCRVVAPRQRAALPLQHTGIAGAHSGLEVGRQVDQVRVLLVDDQETFMRALVAVVGATPNFDVAGQARTGEESLVLASEVNPDLVIMDVNLPGIDGLEATRRLRARSTPPVVMLVSTHDEDAGEQFVAESGANEYVTKSAISPQRLADCWSRSRV